MQLVFVVMVMGVANNGAAGPNQEAVAETLAKHEKVPDGCFRYRESTSDSMREEIERYMTSKPCPVCQGARLKKESLAVKIGGLSIADFTELPLNKALCL